LLMMIALTSHELTLLLICMLTNCQEYVLSYVFGRIIREGNYYSLDAGMWLFIFVMSISNQSIADDDWFNMPFTLLCICMPANCQEFVLCFW
jgi:hypothetical protein